MNLEKERETQNIEQLWGIGWLREKIMGKSRVRKEVKRVVGQTEVEREVGGGKRGIGG